MARFPRPRLTVCYLSLLAFCSAAMAGGIPTLETVEVVAGSEGLIGEAATASEGTVTAGQLENRPLLRPAEVLETIPGLIVSQHSGDGKANQYYLRGFNLDHGSDFAVSLMGMPANLPSHAHGQGYLDLQFLIPELIDRIQYRKGPYAAEVGDFATAGSATIDYVRKLDSRFAEIGIGQNAYRRALLAGSPEAGDGHWLYALEWQSNDGPWTLPENYRRLNGVLRLSQGTKANGWALTAMAYAGDWAATDQVPQRAIASGLIGRYGNLDPSDGGKTYRYSLSGEWSAKDKTGWTRANAYFLDVGLNLWSNFSFCTLGCKPGPGDQFEQTDQRQVYGLNTARTWILALGERPVDITLGLQARHDDIGVGLYTTTARQRWGTVSQDRVREGSLGLYAESQVQWHDKFRSIVGLREDFYRFDVASDTPQNSGQLGARIASPKLSLIFGPWAQTELYANQGYGFHSNDARGIMARQNPDFRDPAYGTAMRPASPLVRAKGTELGMRSALFPGLQTSLAVWRLDLASELVFAGDAGTTEPSFPSRRSGVEWSNYWTPADGLTLDADLALSRAHYTTTDGSVTGSHIPGAIEKTASLGLSLAESGPWSGGIRLRYFGPRPLTEDNTIRSPASTLLNLRVGYRIDRQTRVFLDVLNLFDRKVSDIDYYYASQLPGEAAPQAGIHTHPAEPRSLRLSLRQAF